MTTNDSKRLTQHHDNPKIAAHDEEKLLQAYTEDSSAASVAAAESVDPIFNNSRRGNVPAAIKWGIAVMLALAVASAVAVVIGMSHHRNATDNTYASAYLTPGGNFILEGSHAQQFGYADGTPSALYGNQNKNTSTQSENTATALSSDGQARLVAIADPSTRMIYLFAIDAASIPENSTLNEFARRIAKSDNDVSVVAYADQTGSADHNRRLSDKRANALGKYLISHGVDPKHVKISGKGMTHAFGPNSLNRRAELHF